MHQQKLENWENCAIVARRNVLMVQVYFIVLNFKCVLSYKIKPDLPLIITILIGYYSVVPSTNNDVDLPF